MRKIHFGNRKRMNTYNFIGIATLVIFVVSFILTEPTNFDIWFYLVLLSLPISIILFILGLYERYKLYKNPDEKEQVRQANVGSQKDSNKYRNDTLKIEEPIKIVNKAQNANEDTIEKPIQVKPRYGSRKKMNLFIFIAFFFEIFGYGLLVNYEKLKLNPLIPIFFFYQCVQFLILAFIEGRKIKKYPDEKEQAKNVKYEKNRIKSEIRERNRPVTYDKPHESFLESLLSGYAIYSFWKFIFRDDD